jgi:uncharacterized membrane protein
MAQESTPDPIMPQFALITTFPSRVIGIGETATMKLTLEPAPELEIVQLEISQIPEGWTATFRGEGQIVTAVEVRPGVEAPVDLQLSPPPDVQPGDYHFVVLAQDSSVRAELPIDLTVKDKLPPRMSLNAELPTLSGAPSNTFRYGLTLKNEGDEDLNVNLTADAPGDFQVKFKLNGQEANSLPLSAGASESISVEAQPIGGVSAGSYPIAIHALAPEAEADLALTAQVTGQSQLTVSAPDGRLSAQANAGRATPIKIVLENTGTEAARGVLLTSNEPSGWLVTFNLTEVPEVPAGQSVEVTANVKPPDKAVAGDYVVTIQAKSLDGVTKMADFRITVLTSTLWGIVGIALIAVSVGAVGLAVARFGRR